mmetsp:Transcript_8370/g.9600  ORF Transcript_8370/g.9600 Transcript_8370/m.9600 type:complete len:106 (+) Transcript_8370:525-842(+)
MEKDVQQLLKVLAPCTQGWSYETILSELRFDLLLLMTPKDRRVPFCLEQMRQSGVVPPQPVERVLEHYETLFDNTLGKVYLTKVAEYEEKLSEQNLTFKIFPMRI